MDTFFERANKFHFRTIDTCLHVHKWQMTSMNATDNSALFIFSIHRTLTMYKHRIIEFKLIKNTLWSPLLGITVVIREIKYFFESRFFFGSIRYHTMKCRTCVISNRNQSQEHCRKNA